MFSQNNKISMRQLEILLFLDLFSTAVLILPRRAAEFANQDGWIIVILSTFLALFYSWIITYLASRFPKDTFVEFSSKILSKPVGIILSLFLFIKICFNTAMELRIFGELVKQILLPRTPIEVIMISMLFVSAYLVRQGYEARGRLGEILFFVIFIPIISILLFVLPVTDFRNLKPILTTPLSKLLKGSYDLGFTFSYIEFLLMVAPLVKNPKGLKKSAFKVIGMVGFINVILVIVTLGVFGSIETKEQIWPVIGLMQVIEIPGAFLERQDALMMIFWITSVFSLISAGLYFVSFIITRIMEVEEHKFLVFPMIPIIYLIALIPDNIAETLDSINIMKNYFRISFLFPIPLILIIVAKIRKLGETIEKK
ncbi:GerAB/ArcD/ProY family transporter [Defluviitalea phaphyphila]|uniref:GerAB/ArcD/ProY family transporter n=1 Tax=Defluviitalea phaphyphila TaxID=1473580 RepID=UPI000730F42A|nr:endospore germination permease [Defluviitalea phaphyphila]